MEVRVNCEQNSLLYLVRPRCTLARLFTVQACLNAVPAACQQRRRTGACHTKGPDGISRPSCYYRRIAWTGPAIASSQHATVRCNCRMYITEGCSMSHMRRSVWGLQTLAIGSSLYSRDVQDRSRPRRLLPSLQHRWPGAHCSRRDTIQTSLRYKLSYLRLITSYPPPA